MSNFTTAAERLCDENAKLRDDVERMFKANVEKNGEITRLLDENIKMRELISSMMRFFEDGNWCVKCERAHDCQEREQYEDDCLMRFVFRDRMHELGIEIDG